jgi:hypothetical protein
MELFHILVISFAIIFLIIILTIIGILMKYQDKSTVFPPVANKCPDYWTLAAFDGKSCNLPGSSKKNVGTLYDTTNALQIKPGTTVKTGTSTSIHAFPVYTPATNSVGNTDNVFTDPIQRIDFTNEAWGNQGKTDICAKKQWADNWGISWDGISNYNNC